MTRVHVARQVDAGHLERHPRRATADRVAGARAPQGRGADVLLDVLDEPHRGPPTPLLESS